VTNFERIRLMSSRELKDWYCEGRDCGECPFGTQIVCGFYAWLYASADEDGSKEHPPWYEEPLETLNLGVRAYRALYESGIRTLGQLSELRAFDLQGIFAVGSNYAQEIAERMEAYCGKPMRP